MVTLAPLMKARTTARIGAALATATWLLAAAPLPAQPTGPVDARLLAALRWRNLGPFRAGRVAAVTGAVGQPGVFYIGLPAGGVWKTTSAGATWFPVFDDVTEVSSIGAVEAAPSDANAVYAGTGDMITGGAINEGNGVWVSRDAGRTWRHAGLEATKQIPSIVVDPRDARTVLVAAQGDVHVKSGDRGVFRTTDGGATWTRTLFVDSTTGAQKLARAADAPDVVFATTVRHYVAPGVPSPPPNGIPASDTARTGTYVYKSTDGGATWRELPLIGLPRLTGRTSIAVAAHTSAQRVFLVANSGFYRSDDGGATWRAMAADDERIRNGQGGYNSGVYVDPQNPDVVYTISTSSYRSTDGGATFTGFKGAPGGDDPQQLWIDPTDGRRMLLGLDQGAVVTLDGGGTWSSWYNQSTEQIYHISTDNSTPYWIYGTQQDAGTIRIRARGRYGAIGPLDWSPVPGWEWGTIIADPADPNTVWSSGVGVVRISYPSEQSIDLGPSTDAALALRATNSQPLVFAPWNRHLLLAGYQKLMGTTDGGAHWTALSPDLTTGTLGTPARAGPPNPPNGGTAGGPGAAIESIAPTATGTIWVGTSNGRTAVTRDAGKTWADVTIPGVPTAGRVLVAVEASPENAAEAYAAVDGHYIGDYAPYLFRTRDAGRTWTPIVAGLPVRQPSGSFVRVVRADSVRAGLLFAGTESGMFVSFDDGDHWQPIQQNLPTTSYRDIRTKGSDLIVATYGRGLWVLDGFPVLRQLGAATAARAAELFAPADAVRLRRNVNQDTPFPPEVPQAPNGADGVIVDYWLARAPAGPVTLDVLDAAGAVVRHLTSAAAAPVAEAARPPHPNFWVAAPEALPAAVGANRTSWDLRYDAPPALRHSFEINANPGRTPPSPEGPLAPPGVYTLRLTVDGQHTTRTVTVKPDPSSPATPAALRAQHALQMRLVEGLRASAEGYRQAAALRAALGGTGALPAATSAFLARVDTVAGTLDASRARGRGGRDAPTFVSLSATFGALLNAQEPGDAAPTPGALAAYAKACGDLHSAAAAWTRVRAGAPASALPSAATPALDAAAKSPGC
ncbi:MAG: hypothetical protein JO180_02450 [Gemmatirosa sp.]|nr:hypothetical protein [Gemmatirosa sp.]